MIENAKIESTFLGQGDHGEIACWLHLMYNKNSGQGFGDMTLDIME